VACILPGSVAFRQIVVGMNLEREGEKRALKGNLQGSRLLFPLSNPPASFGGVGWRGLQMRRDLGRRGGWLTALFLWLVCLIVRVFDR
jgi:hypothetical protein